MSTPSARPLLVCMEAPPRGSALKGARRFIEEAMAPLSKLAEANIKKAGAGKKK